MKVLYIRYYSLLRYKFFINKKSQSEFYIFQRYIVEIIQIDFEITYFQIFITLAPIYRCYLYIAVCQERLIPNFFILLYRVEGGNPKRVAAALSPRKSPVLTR